MTDLAGVTALVTGASSGLGAHAARLLARHGARVALVARREGALEELAVAIRAEGGEALAVAGDVTCEADVQRAFDAAGAAFGPVTAVLANAGVNRSGSALDLDIAAFDEVFAANVRGVFLTAREAARRMQAAGRAEEGRIVLVSSITAAIQTRGLAAYSASKAAVTHLGRLLAHEWSRSGPSVNVVSPGYFRSELAGDWFEGEQGQRQVRSMPRGRLMTVDALDRMLLFLLSPASQFVTGSDFCIDDGQSL